jgi:DNA primase catalytic subunit
MSRSTQVRATDHPLKESLRQYYETQLIDLTPIPDLRFRHFRLRLLDETFHKVKRKINSSKELQKYLIDYVPLDVYYSTAKWLNPHLIASRLDKDILKNIYLGCDLSFDIDVSHKLNSLEDARRESLKLHDLISGKGFKMRYAAFSGSKGFHLVYEDPWTGFEEPDPHRRELKAIEERKKLVSEASELGLLFDEKVTVDTRRIIRVPGTINSKTGLVCKILTLGELDSDIEDILKLAVTKTIPTPRIPNGEMTAPSANKIPGALGRLGVRPKPTVTYSLFFTNNIPKTRLKVPIIEFDGWMGRRKVFDILEEAQQRYHLGTLYIFKDSEKYWAMSLKALPRRRVEKILGFAGSRNLNQSRKYGCTYTRIGRSVDEGGETEKSEPTFIAVIESETKGQQSKTHREFLSSLGIKVDKVDCGLCGADISKLELVYAVVE